MTDYTYQCRVKAIVPGTPPMVDCKLYLYGDLGFNLEAFFGFRHERMALYGIKTVVPNRASHVLMERTLIVRTHKNLASDGVPYAAELFTQVGLSLNQDLIRYNAATPLPDTHWTTLDARHMGRSS